MRSLKWAALALALAFVGSLAAEEKQTKPAAKVVPAVRIAPVKNKDGRAPSTPAEKNAAEKGTHKHTSSLDIKGSDGQGKMQTLAVDDSGRVLALVAPPRGFSGNAKTSTSEVQVYSPEGKKVASWTVKFHANSINADDKGNVYVAGDGKVAKFDKDGKALAETKLPHIDAASSNTDQMKKDAEKQIAQMKESFAQSVKQFTEMKKKIEDIAEDKRTALQKRQLQQYDLILKNQKENEKYYDSMKVETIMASQLSRLRTINSVAVTKQDLFIACGETKGYGYAVWRMDHDFGNAKQIISGLGGCCGQMDVQVSGDKVLVAQNTGHNFIIYDRDGKKLSAHGKRGKDTEPECFGSCCNPMNLRASKTGDIYTAESEGIIKRFSSKGEFLETVGYAPLTGGCKNVAVGVSPDAKRVYFADQPGSRVIVLTKKDEKAE